MAEKLSNTKLAPNRSRVTPVAGSKSKPTVIVVQDWNGCERSRNWSGRENSANLDIAPLPSISMGRECDHQPFRLARAESGKYYADPALYLQRLKGGIKAANVTGKFIAIGYCFGGTGVLELARDNVKNLAGVVSFHGGLKALSVSPAKINSRVLVLHGAVDPFVPAADVDAAKLEFKRAKSFKFVAYPGAVHAFTVKSMGFEVDGAKYSAVADTASWKELMTALKTW